MLFAAFCKWNNFWFGNFADLLDLKTSLMLTAQGLIRFLHLARFDTFSLKGRRLWQHMFAVPVRTEREFANLENIFDAHCTKI